MEESGKNMQDVRNELKIKSIRWKIEKRVLQRIGHILRMDDRRMTKIAILGWYEELKKLPKRAGRKRKMLHYWRKLLR